MTNAAGHRRNASPLATLLIALPLATLALLLVPVRAGASPSTVSSMSANAVVAQARAAMTRAGSVSAIGSGTTTIAGIGRAKLTETDYTDAISGSQVVAMTSGKANAAALPSAATLDVAGAVFVNANVPFWTATLGMGTTPAIQVAGRWVQIPTSSPAYGPAAADLTMSSLVQDMFHANAKGYHKGTMQTVDGTRVIAITYVNTGNDSGPVTCDVAAGGYHLPVRVTIGGLTLHLGQWGKAQPVSAPSGVIPLPSLNSSSPSPLPVAV